MRLPRHLHTCDLCSFGQECKQRISEIPLNFQIVHFHCRVLDIIGINIEQSVSVIQSLKTEVI